MVNGRDISAIGLVIREAMENLERPMLIVLDTVKGAGIPCIESLENNHCIGVPQPLAEKAMSELMLEKPEAYDETEI